MPALSVSNSMKKEPERVQSSTEKVTAASGQIRKFQSDDVTCLTWSQWQSRLCVVVD